MLMLVLLGLAAIGLFILVLLVIFKRLARPAESLQNWASQLTMQDLDKPLPDFTFRELNELATLIRNNIASEANAIKREQTFLSYASHELRTPIAVLRTNATLLDKINPNPTDKERKVRDRISRASLTMKSMTETLLWLSRDEAIDMPVEPVKFGELLQQLSDELGYLLNGKEIELSLYSDGSNVEVAKTPCLIMLNNLIRNAFQHTQQGLVSISHNQNQVQIYNKEAEQTPQIPTEVGENLGFGLGMQLVDKLAKQFGWRFESEQKGNEFKVRIQF
jgi:signal transduction histidine kinase